MWRVTGRGRRAAAFRLVRSCCRFAGGSGRVGLGSRGMGRCDGGLKRNVQGCLEREKVVVVERWGDLKLNGDPCRTKLFRGS